MPRFIETLIKLSGKTEYEIGKQSGLSSQTMRSMRISKDKISQENLGKLIKYFRTLMKASTILDVIQGKRTE